eukprot:4232916-Amphidinium_carterae.1
MFRALETGPPSENRWPKMGNQRTDSYPVIPGPSDENLPQRLCGLSGVQKRVDRGCVACTVAGSIPAPSARFTILTMSS